MDSELPPSKLGTKEHWDETYAKELQNFHDNGDPGEIWFSLACQHRVVNWLKRQNNVSVEETSVLDIGCGNGALLIELAGEGFQKLTGIDYSPAAVELAKQVAHRDLDSPNIEFLVADILHPGTSPLTGRTFTVCLDKGTYDAISLDPTEPNRKRKQYAEKVWSLLTAGGLFIITSCNWTKDELIKHYTQWLSFKDVIPAPTFQFGGKTGHTVTTIVFEKLKQE
jgi:SAM-dependent methyltransferase